MIVCEHCGTKNNDNFNCCYNCGTPLKKKTNRDEEKKVKPILLELEEQEDEEIDVSQPVEADEESVADDGEIIPVDISAEEAPEELYEEYEDEVEEEYDEPQETASYYSSAYEDEAPKPKKAPQPKPKYPQQKKKPKFEINVTKLVPVLALLLVALLVIWGTGRLLDMIFSGSPGATPGPSVTESPSTSNFNTEAFVYSDFDENGNKVFTIAITTQGETVYVMNNQYPVEDGAVQVTVSETDIYRLYRPSDVQAGQSFDATLPIIIQKDGFKDYVYNVTVNGISTPSAPFELVSPSSQVTEIFSSTTTISFIVDKSSKVYINGEDYTEAYLNKETGEFSITIQTPISQDPYRILAKVETAGYMTREVVFELTRTQSWDPNAEPTITLDKASVVANAECLATITGVFMGNPQDLVFVDKVSGDELEIVSITMSEDGDGKFTAVIKATKLGWAEISVECKTNLDYTAPIFVQCMSNALGGFDQYSRSCKDVLDNYKSLKSYQGNRFVTYASHYAIITSVVNGELGDAFYAKLNTGTDEQLIYVETCTDSFTFEEGRKVRVFANLCGEKDGTPRFIAVQLNSVP